MALSIFRDLALSPMKYTRSCPMLWIASCDVSQVRYKNRRDRPKTLKWKRFLQRHTDVIKHLSILLVKHERVFTTLSKAKQLQEYGDLLINLTQRKEPPPDLFMIKDGFVITEEEAIELRMRRRIVNRMSRRVYVPPAKLSEEEFVEKCKLIAGKILLEDEEAIEKLYGTLAKRFNGQYGGFTKLTPIPLPEKKPYPNLAYIEYIGNNLKPLPEMPALFRGYLRANPRSGVVANETDVIEYN